MVSTRTSINASLSVTLGMMLLAVAAGALAAGNAPGHIESCKSEVRQQFGMDTEVMLVSERRNASGTLVKLAARLDQDNTTFVNCWVPGNEEGINGYGRGADAFATRLEPATNLLPY